MMNLHEIPNIHHAGVMAICHQKTQLFLDLAGTSAARLKRGTIIFGENFWVPAIV